MAFETCKGSKVQGKTHHLGEQLVHLPAFGFNDSVSKNPTTKIGKNSSFGVIRKIRAGNVVEKMVVINSIEGCSQV